MPQVGASDSLGAAVLQAGNAPPALSFLQRVRVWRDEDAIQPVGDGKGEHGVLVAGEPGVVPEHRCCLSQQGDAHELGLSCWHTWQM